MGFEAPQEIDDAAVVFGGDMAKLLPPMGEIPEEFNDYQNPWAKKVGSLFYNGGSLPKVKSGIDPALARRHLAAVIGSFEPAHEHKIAGAAYLMSLWYESADPAPTPPEGASA